MEKICICAKCGTELTGFRCSVCGCAWYLELSKPMREEASHNANTTRDDVKPSTKRKKTHQLRELKELEEEYWSLAGGKYDHEPYNHNLRIVWNWILSHAREIGELSR